MKKNITFLRIPSTRWLPCFYSLLYTLSNLAVHCFIVSFDKEIAKDTHLQELSTGLNGRVAFNSSNNNVTAHDQLFNYGLFIEKDVHVNLCHDGPDRYNGRRPPRVCWLIYTLPSDLADRYNGRWPPCVCWLIYTLPSDLADRYNGRCPPVCVG